MSSNQTNSYVVVPKKVPDWSKIEYMLQLSLGTSTAIIKNMWSVSKPHLNLQFEKMASQKNKLKINSFVDVRSLDSSTSLERIIKEGFDIPEAGKKFTTGFFQLEKEDSSGVYKILLCKVAVGKSLCLPIKKRGVKVQNKVKRTTLPPGFDSIYLMYRDHQANKLYQYDYVVFENAQVRPQYLIEFYFDDTKEKEEKDEICETKDCTEKATLYCINDKMSICETCNKEIHVRGWEAAKRHEVVDIKKVSVDIIE